MVEVISFSDSITIRREGDGYYDKGEWVKGNSKDFSAMASVQPQSMKTIVSDSEGERNTDAIKIYTETEILAGSDDHNADLVKFNGKWYELTSVRFYTQLTLPHYKAIGILLNKEDQREES